VGETGEIGSDGATFFQIVHIQSSTAPRILQNSLILDATDDLLARIQQENPP
jgi:hypothetical protein